jgi:hypothetical protein
MKRRTAARAICVIGALLTTEAQERTSSPPTLQLDTFLSQLQRAVAADDRAAVVATMRYPITISIGGLRVPFGSAASVLDRYDDIFNPPLRAAIARASAATYRGAGIVIEPAGGRLWMTSIVVPHFVDGSQASAVAGPDDASRGGAVRKQEPRRVAIRVGPRPTQIPGLLARGGTDSLIIFLPKGNLAAIRLERVPAGAAVVRVLHAKTGVPLSARVSTDGRFVSGRAAEDGDYRIEVQRTDNADEAHLPYMLSLSLR